MGHRDRVFMTKGAQRLDVWKTRAQLRQKFGQLV
jgi:hypothetical protein